MQIRRTVNLKFHVFLVFFIKNVHPNRYSIVSVIQPYISPEAELKAPPPPPQHTFQFAEFHPEKRSLRVIKSSLILKVAKNFRETFFRGVELIRVEVM